MLDGNDAATSEHFVLLIGHLEEEQVGELFQVVAVGQAVVAQHVTEVPQLLHHRLRIVQSIQPTLTVGQSGHQYRSESALG